MPEVGNIKPKIYQSDGYETEFGFDLLRIDDILLYVHLIVRVGPESSAVTFWEGCMDKIPTGPETDSHGF